MSHRIYIDSILEPVVKPWILDMRAGRINNPFILEEDGDPSHRGGKANNPVRRWKQEMGLKYYFNYPGSLDLAPIKNLWQAPKQALRKVPHWDDQSMRAIINDAWDGISQPFINERVHTMPDRLRAVIAGEGVMTGY